MRRSPAIEASFNPDAPRLACVRPAASVHPEPGSNSPLYKMFCFKSLALISKVLFEITLSREWKTFSCSNTSKNAVQIYCYKEQFFLFRRVCPCGFSRCSDRRFFSGKWCKDKSYFLNHQIFLKEFFQKFSEPFLLSFRTVFLIRSGCKGKSFF